jgi:hypothetical protein
MGQLLFKKCFWQAIRDGTKTTTIRRWSSPRVKVGERAYSPGIGYLKIESVDVIPRLESLTDADARADGFPSAAEMRRVLRALYPTARGKRAIRAASTIAPQSSPARSSRTRSSPAPARAPAASSPPSAQSSDAKRWFKIAFRVAD